MTDPARIDEFERVVETVADYMLKERLKNIYCDIRACDVSDYLKAKGLGRVMAVVYIAMARVREMDLPVEELCQISRQLDDEV